MINKKIARPVKSAVAYLIGLLAIILMTTVRIRRRFPTGRRRPAAAGGGKDPEGIGAKTEQRPTPGSIRAVGATTAHPAPGQNQGRRGNGGTSQGSHYQGDRRSGGSRQGTVVRQGGRNSGGRNGGGAYRYPGKQYHAPRSSHYRNHGYRRPYRGYGRPYWRPYWGYRRPYWGYSPGIGTVFLTLPLGCAGLSIGGSLYYYYDSIYYQPVPSGYVVVAPPVASVPQIVSEGTEYTQVSVTVSLLNVRSGPGPGNAVIRQVRRGDILDVAGETDGWLYVELSGGENGWIDAQYTAPMVYVDR